MSRYTAYKHFQRPAQVYNPWVFANYGQPQRQRGYVSPVVYQTRYPMPYARLPRVRRWVGDPAFNNPLGVTIDDLHAEMRKGTVLTYVGIGMGVLGLYLTFRMMGKKS